MINDLKKLYEQSASEIEWKSKTKNQLVFGYIENENTNLKDAYFSAIVLKYWHLIGKYYKMSYLAATEEDCYDWLIESIWYAITHRRWEDEDSSIYNDPNGPDKVINRHMACMRYTYYQAINRKKRKEGFNPASLDEMFDEFSDHTDISDNIFDLYEEDYTNMDVKSFVRNLFIHGNYLSAYIVHIILHTDVFMLNDDGYFLSAYKLARAISSLNDSFCDDFAEEYNFDSNAVRSTLKNILGLHSDYLDYLVRISIATIESSEYITMIKKEHHIDC